MRQTDQTYVYPNVLCSQEPNSHKTEQTKLFQKIPCFKEAYLHRQAFVAVHVCHIRFNSLRTYRFHVHFVPNDRGSQFSIDITMKTLATTSSGVETGCTSIQWLLEYIRVCMCIYRLYCNTFLFCVFFFFVRTIKQMM